MATTQKKTWQDVFGDSQIGNFKEAAGGGTPMERGQKIDAVVDTPQEAAEYKKNKPGAIVRVKQPRDSDGQFTYNSANRKELEYGPSRGTTIPPFMKDWGISFSKKSGKGTFISSSGKKYFMPETVKDAKGFIDMFREFRKDEDGSKFGDFSLGETAKGKGGRTPNNYISFSKSAFRGGYGEAKPKRGEKGEPVFAGKKPQQNPAPKTETPTAPSTTAAPKAKAGVDTNMAKTNPTEFARQNRSAIKEVIDMADKKGININADKMIEAFGNGELKSFDEIKSMIEKA